MAANLFKLVGSIYVDTDKANESLSKTDQKAEGVGSKLAGAGKKAAAFGGAVAAAAGVAIGAMKNQADATAEAADAIDKGSQKMGIGAEEYQKLSYAAELSGTSIDTLQKAQQKLQAAGADFDITGALDQLYAIEDADERAAAAHEMFGDKVANELAPMLNAGKEGFEAMTAEAEKLGLVMSDDAVKAGASYNDTMTALNKSMDALKNTLGTAMIPIFQSVASIILDNMPQIQEIMNQLAPILAEMLEELAPLIAEIMPLIIDMLPTIVELAKSIIPPVIEVAKSVIPVLIDVLNTVIPIVADILEELAPLISDIMPLIIDMMPIIINLAKQIIPPILEVAKDIIPYLIDILKTFMPIIQNIIDFISNVFTGNWSAAWENVVNIFKNYWEALKTIFTKPINWIIDKLNSFIKYVNKIQIPDWVPGLGGKGLNIPEIPKLRRGISRVPNDDYPALLHEGERVLTEDEAAEYNRGESNSDIATDIYEVLRDRLTRIEKRADVLSVISDNLKDRLPRIEHRVDPLAEINQFTQLIDQDLGAIMKDLKTIREMLTNGKAKTKAEITNVKELGKAVATS